MTQHINLLISYYALEEINKGILQSDVGTAVEIYEKYWNLLKTGGK